MTRLDGQQPALLRRPGVGDADREAGDGDGERDGDGEGGDTIGDLGRPGRRLDGDVDAGAEGGEPGEHGEVPVAPEERPVEAVDLRLVVAAEVAPPHGEGDHQGGGGDDQHVELDADRVDRLAHGDRRRQDHLAEDDDREQAEALGEVSGVELLAGRGPLGPDRDGQLDEGEDDEAGDAERRGRRAGRGAAATAPGRR